MINLGPLAYLPRIIKDRTLLRPSVIINRPSDLDSVARWKSMFNKLDVKSDNGVLLIDKDNCWCEPHKMEIYP